MPDHVRKNRRTGVGQAWFPENWSEKTIKKAGEHVFKHGKLSSKSNESISQSSNSNIKKYSRYKGVMVQTISDDKSIRTVCPAFYQNLPKRSNK